MNDRRRIRRRDSELASVLEAYGIAAEHVAAPNHAAGYDVDHSSFLYLVDRRGQLRGLVPINTQTEDVVHDLELLLKMPA